MRRLRSVVLLVLLWPSLVVAQNGALEQVRNFRRAHEARLLREFVALLAIPNVASDSENIRKNAAFIVEMMKARGLTPQLLEAENSNVPPAVYGEWKTPGATRTLVLYAHYDGQPTDPAQWTGSRPWEPVLRSGTLEAGGTILPMPGAGEAISPDWRMYARSASDDKAGVMVILNALAALSQQGIPLTSNIKFLFEGEEEAGSTHLGEIIARHRDLLAADAWIICDGPVHQTGRKQVVFGVRGDVNVDLTVYGAKRPLHSGHYGNWAPNPGMRLAQLLASMKDATGRVTIADWYADVETLGPVELRAIAQAPANDADLAVELGLARPDGDGKSLLELINQPSLNVNGMKSGDVGALARNVIPTNATAVLDLRLVKGNDHRRQVQRLIAHIRKQGFHVLDHEPSAEERLKYPLLARVVTRGDGYNAERTRMDLPLSQAVIAAVQSTSKEPLVKLPTAGGSLPLSIITNNLTTVTITVPIANHDNNQHAENENIRLQNLWDGMETYAALMTMRP
jgi:acetylornithine deacetylase/succinyl-diaminopimelate desuccinylase-like protein